MLPSATFCRQSASATHTNNARREPSLLGDTKRHLQRERRSQAHIRVAAAESSAATQASNGAERPGEQQIYDPMRATVQPSFRSTPREDDSSEGSQAHGRLLFVSESNVCRSVLAEAFLRSMTSIAGLAEQVSIESKACRDYNTGEPPDPTVVRAAGEIGLALPEGKVAELFDPSRDISIYDLVLVMDKFTAADVLREVSIFDTIHKGNSYTSKVRRLGEFHPGLLARGASDDQDIGDPLYGNTGGPEELVAVQEVAEVIHEACNGLLAFLQQVEKQAAASGTTFRRCLQEATSKMEGIEWMVPPMLQKK